MLELTSQRVLITEPEAYRPDCIGPLPSNWECNWTDIRDNQTLKEVIRSDCFDIVFAKLGLSFDEEFFRLAKSLKILATPTTGLNHIDTQFAATIGVDIVSLKGEVDFLRNITSTAEHAWSLLLYFSRNLLAGTQRPLNGQWHREGLSIHQLAGKTLGIIGYGRLGKILGEYGSAFRMNVIANDPFLAESEFNANAKQVELMGLLEESDYIILAASYQDRQKPILGEKELMATCKKPGFINISRGELVDEHALLKAYDTGRLSFMGLDVLVNDSTWNKHYSPISELIMRSERDVNIAITPHVGGYAVEAVASTRAFIVKQVCSKMERESL